MYILYTSKNPRQQTYLLFINKNIFFLSLFIKYEYTNIVNNKTVLAYLENTYEIIYESVFVTTLWI